MKLIRLNIILFILSIFVLISCQKNNTNQPKNNTEQLDKTDLFKAQDTTWKSLSLREKIGQTMIIRAYHKEQVDKFGSIENMMKQYPVGGIFVPFWEFIGKMPDSAVVPSIKKVVADYQKSARFPVFVTEDFERGVGSVYKTYTHMPAEMSLGAANDTSLAFKYGNAIAKEASDLGVNWLLHPLTDLNMNPMQDLIVERAISDNPELALPLLKSQIKGINAHNTIATIKHFPGDGATMRNQHFVTSANNLSVKEWNNSFGKIYQDLIDNDIDCIMAGHIRFPAYQTEKLNGVLPPATLSKELLNGLLKEKMNFKGVIISDALNMGGVAGYYPNELETAVAAFEAGVDMVLWPDLAYMDTIESRIKRGVIPMKRLDDAVKRIWRLREKHGLNTKKDNYFYHLTTQDRQEIKETGALVAQSAVTLLSDPKNIPITPEKDPHLLIVNLSFNDKTGELAYTKKLLEEKGFKVDTILHNPRFFDWDRRLDYFNGFDKIIVAMENKYFDPLGAAMLKGQEADAVWTMNMVNPEKIIAVSYSNPYYVNFYFENAYAKVNAYSLDKFSQKAVVDALTGKILFKGKSPVKLDHEIMK